MKRLLAVLLMLAAPLLSAVACAETTERAVHAAVTVNGVSFAIEFEDNETAAAFQALLPVTLSLRELNGNEKFVFLDEALPSNAERASEIRTGDLMLYGDDCVVLFYESFTTSYSYTRIGRIADPSALSDAAGAGDVVADFSFE